MKPRSFRLRIALLSALISGCVLAAFSVAAWYSIYQARLAGLDREIRALAYRHPGWMAGRANYERLSSAIEFIFGEDRKEQLLLLVADAQGQIRYRSPHWPPTLDPSALDLHLEDAVKLERPNAGAPSSAEQSSKPEPSPRRGPPWGAGAGPGRGSETAQPLPDFSKVPRFFTRTADPLAWRFGVLGNDSDRLVLGLGLSDLQAEMARLRNAFLIVLPLALLAIALGGWWVAGYAVRPLESIAQVAERVTSRGLDQRIPTSTEDKEIARLIHVLNGMIDRLERSFQQASRFSADASHELKTPLAVMQAELEDALQAAPSGSPEQRVYAGLLEETQRLKTITRSLLLLAQADAGHLPLALAPLDLSEALVGLMEDMEALAAESRITVEHFFEPGLHVQADWPLLRQAISNLLHNALRYNEPDGWIQVSLKSGAGRVELGVCNGGPGIPAADQPKIFDRFFRADPSRNRRVDGVGLGLSLAKEITHAHRGSLRLQESRPGRTCFKLSMPIPNERSFPQRSWPEPAPPLQD